MQAQAKTKFKKTPIGEIPEEWKVVELEDVAERRSEIVNPNAVGNLPFVGLEHIEPGRIRLTQWGNSGEVKSSKSKFYPGDVLYGKLRPYLDKAIIAEFKGICSTDIIVIKTKSNKLIPEYLIWLVHTKAFLKYAKKTMKGVNHPRTSWNALKKFKIPLPPLPEQKKIAEILRTVDDAIEKTDEAIERTERLKKGLMQRLLTKGIKHELFKKTELGEIPEEWRVVKFKEVVISYKNGIYKPREYYGRGYPCIRMYNIVSGRVTKENAPLLAVTEKELKEYGLLPGDIVINRVNAPDLVGKAGVVPKNFGKATFESKNIRVRVDTKKLLPEFFAIFAQTNSYIVQVKARAKTAVAQATITQKDLDSIKLPLPPLEEQKQIAEILSTVDRKLELLRGRREKLERVKRGLMKDLLTGRRRVKIE